MCSFLRRNEVTALLLLPDIDLCVCTFRMTTTLPYNLSKKSPDGSTLGSGGVSPSFNSSGSCPPQAIS